MSSLSATRSLSHGYALLARVEQLAVTRRGALALFVISLGVFAIQSVAMPVQGGRDFGSYLGYYVQMFDAHPPDVGLSLARTPIAPLAIGLPLDIGGGVAATIWMALLYAGSVVAWSWVALSFGARAALATALLLLLYPGYGILFHQLSSDPIFAAAFAGWAVLVTLATRRPSALRFLLVGLGVAFLAGVRPGSQVLALFVFFPLFVTGARGRTRLAWAAAVFAGIAVPLGALMVNNGVRYGNYTVANGATTFPLFRAFVADKIVQPDNGPVSREFARGVEKYLLKVEPYRSYGITSDEFFSSGSTRMQADIDWVAERVWGSEAPSKQRALWWEAIRTHPRAYAGGVSQSLWDLLWKIRVWAPVSTDGGGQTGAAQDTVNVGGRSLPKPPDGQPIPGSHSGEIWVSATEHRPDIDDADRETAAEDLREFTHLSSLVPVYGDSEGLAHRLNQASRWYPAPLIFLLLGLAGLAIRRPRRPLIALALSVAALLILLLTSLGFYAVAEYVVPVAPAFIVLAAAGLIGDRRADESRRPGETPVPA